MSNEELEKKQTKGDSVWTEGSGVPVPQEPDGGILKPKKPVKMGKVRTAAPSRDGIAAKGKTKGMMPKMAGSKPLGMKKGGKC